MNKEELIAKITEEKIKENKEFIYELNQNANKQIKYIERLLNEFLANKINVNLKSKYQFDMNKILKVKKSCSFYYFAISFAQRGQDPCTSLRETISLIKDYIIDLKGAILSQTATIQVYYLNHKSLGMFVEDEAMNNTNDILLGGFKIKFYECVNNFVDNSANTIENTFKAFYSITRQIKAFEDENKILKGEK